MKSRIFKAVCSLVPARVLSSGSRNLVLAVDSVILINQPKVNGKDIRDSDARSFPVTHPQLCTRLLFLPVGIFLWVFLQVPAPLLGLTVQDYFLHSSGSAYFLDTSSPAGTVANFKDSPAINRKTFQEIGTWSTAPLGTEFDLTSLSNLHLWIGLQNKGDIGTYFDIRAELLKNGEMIAFEEATNIKGVDNIPDNAKEIMVEFAGLSDHPFSPDDVLSLRILAKVTQSGGHNKAKGLRLYYDSVTMPARFATDDLCNHLPQELAEVLRMRNPDSQECSLGGSSSGISKGDFNGDGFADLAIGVPFKDTPSGVTNSGAVIVIYGSATGLTATDPTVPAPQLWSQDTPGIPGSSEPFDLFGHALASGDFNGDGFSDLAVGVPGDRVVNQGAGLRGRVVVIYGSATGLTATDPTVPAPQSWTMIDLDTGRQIAFFAAQTEADIPTSPSVSFGFSLAWGDFNGDGIGDLAVGSPNESVFAHPGDTNPFFGIQGGAVGILLGSPPGSPGLPHGGLSSRFSQVFTALTLDSVSLPLAGDSLGSALAAGNFINHDSISDLAIGIPRSPFPRIFVNSSLSTPANNAGAVQMLRGNFRGLVPDSFFSFGDPNDRFGSVFAAGDFNGDGSQELAVGVPLRNSPSGLADSGAVFIVDFNTAFNSGTPVSTQVLDQDTIFGGRKSAAGDSFGFSLASGDFNGDGVADLAIGVPFKDLAIPNTVLAIRHAGEVDVVYGGPLGLNAGHPPQRWNQNLPNAVPANNGDNFGSSLAAWNFGRNESRFVFQGGRLIPVVSKTADLAIGAPSKSFNATTAGAVSVIYGSFAANGLTSNNSQFWIQETTGIPGQSEAGDFLGFTLY